MRGCVAITTAVAVLVAPVAARADCTKDTDCGGPSVCEDGQCVSASGAEEEGVTVRYAAGARTGVSASSGWALPGAIIGVIGALGVAALSLASELRSDDRQPSLLLEGGAAVLLAAAGPVAFAGGRSARSSGATGITALRVLGWVFYGITLGVDAIVLLVRAGDVDIAPGLITGTGAGGALVLSLFSIDAIVGWDEAQGFAADESGWGPSIGMAKDQHGVFLPTVGAGTRF